MYNDVCREIYRCFRRNSCRYLLKYRADRSQIYVLYIFRKPCASTSAKATADKPGLVRFVDDPAASEGGFLSSAGLSGRDDMEVSVYGNDERVVLVSRFDNLGKGASGAAIQNMNLVLGCPEDEGLVRRA